jgi:hypothetical protein
VVWILLFARDGAFIFCAYPENSSLEPPEADEYQLSSRPKLAIKAA